MNCNICGMETENDKKICDACMSEELDIHEAFTHKFVKKQDVNISYDENYIFVYIRKRNKFYIGDVKKYRPDEVYKFLNTVRGSDKIGLPVYTNVEISSFEDYYNRMAGRL